MLDPVGAMGAKSLTPPRTEMRGDVESRVVPGQVDMG